jgi:peptide chain release factor subunit 1
MISSADLQRLVQRQPGESKVISLYLDMSVTSDNKRTHRIYLSQQMARFAELSSERETHHREPIGEAFARIQRWLEEAYDESNRGVAIFTELGGGWFEALQLPVPLPNRMVIAEHPAVGPLTEVLERHRRYAVGLVDRERLRLFALYMGRVTDEESSVQEPYPTAHDVKAGGMAARDHQKRKAEEARQFFREFAETVERFDRRHAPDRWILLGTEENVRNFTGFLADGVAQRVAHTAHSPVEATASQVLERVQPFIEGDMQRAVAEVVDRVRDRVRNRHFAIAGFNDTLEQLQEGKVETLVIARDLEQAGAQCTRCSFVMLARPGTCPYCGGDLREQEDVVESMVRMAAEQNVSIEYVDAEPLREMEGVGALLRF